MEAGAPPRPQRVLVLANPISGRGRGARAAQALVTGFAHHGVTAEALLTRARGDAARLLAAAGPADLIVAVGGDGTLSEVLQAVGGDSTPLGLFPCGTANVLAHALGLPREPEQAVQSFLRARTQVLDVAQVGKRYAHLVVGVGFDGCVVREVEERRRGPITKAAYVAASLRALRRYRRVPLQVTLDGEPLAEPAGLVWVANTPRYADLLRLAPDVRVDDGQWEVYLFPTGSLRELFTAFLRGLVAHLPGGPVRMRRARSVTVRASEPVPYQVDGDLGGTTPLEFHLLAQRFRIVVP